MDTPPGAPTSDTFDIISTIRSDAILLHSEENTRVNATIKCTLARSPVQFYMLSYHRDRMLASAKAFGWDTSLLEGPEAFKGLLDMLYEHLQKKYNSWTYAAPLMVGLILENLVFLTKHPRYALRFLPTASSQSHQRGPILGLLP